MPLARDVYEKCVAAFLSNYEFEAKKIAVMDVLKDVEPGDLSNVRLYAETKTNDYKKLASMSSIIAKYIMEKKADDLTKN